MNRGSIFFSTDTEEELEWIADLEEKAKNFKKDSSTKEGDIVLQTERKISFLKVKFPCPFCSFLSDYRKDIAKHLRQAHEKDRKEARQLAKNVKATMVPQELKNVQIFYEVVRPREILPLPRNAEVDLKGLIKKGTLPPTPEEREKHDLEMKLWREAMKKGKNSRPDTLKQLSNGSFARSGYSGNWWYFLPEVWRQQADGGTGRWMEPTLQECLNWKNLTIPKRVLYLLGILTDE